MRHEDARVAALAAVFSPGRAGALMSRLSAAPAETVREAARIAAASRRERLEALAAALASAAETERPGPSATAERPGVAALLRGCAEGTADPAASPALVRICRERICR